MRNLRQKISGMVTNYWVLGLIPIGVWSSVAPFIQSVSSASKPFHISIIAILSGAFFSVLNLLLLRKFDLKYIIKQYSKQKVVLWSFLAAVFLCSHYHILYYILATKFVVQANILNYLWPLFLFIFSNLFFGKKDGYSKFIDVIFMVISFFGVILIISTNLESFSYGKTFESPSFLGLTNFQTVALLSVLSAISAASYFIVARKLRSISPDDSTFFALPLVFAALITTVVFPWFVSIKTISIPSISAGLLLGFASVWLSNTLWVTANTLSKNHAFASLGYFVPVFATILLYFFGKFTLETTIFAGVFLILSANFLLHSGANFVSSINICLSFIILFAGYVLLVEPLSVTRQDQLSQSSSTIFALLSAFLLNRVWQNHRRKEEVLAKLITQINVLIKSWHLNDPNYEHNVANAKRFITDMYVSDIRSINFAYKSFLDFILFSSSKGEKRVQLLETLRSWKISKRPSVSAPESMIIILIGSITVVQLLLFRQSDLVGDISAAVFSAAIIFIVFLIHDYDRRIDASQLDISMLSIEIENLNSNEIYVPKGFNILMQPSYTYFTFDNRGNRIELKNNLFSYINSKILSLILYITVTILFIAIIDENLNLFT